MMTWCGCWCRSFNAAVCSTRNMPARHCGAVVETLPATGQAQDYPRLFTDAVMVRLSKAIELGPESVGRLSFCGNHGGNRTKHLRQLGFLSCQADIVPSNSEWYLTPYIIGWLTASGCKTWSDQFLPSFASSFFSRLATPVAPRSRARRYQNSAVSGSPCKPCRWESFK